MTEPKSQTRVTSPRLPGLDLLRLLAVLLVLGRHSGPDPKDAPRIVAYALDAWRRGGWIGVDLFFVLSGFLISGLLFTEFQVRGTLAVPRFYMRRAWKIYPSFWVLIATTVLVDTLLQRHVSHRGLLAELFFVQSYVPGLWVHTWSLAVEEHFYFLLPLVLLLVLRRGRGSSMPFRQVLTVAGWIAVGSLLLRVVNFARRDTFSALTHLFPTHLRFDALSFGVAISYAYHFHSEQFVATLTRWHRALITAGGLCLLPAFLFSLERHPLIYTVGLTVFYVGSGMLLTGVLLSRYPSNPTMWFLARLGAYSYSIYLWHLPVKSWGLDIVEHVVGSSVGAGSRLILYVVGSLIVGVGMAKLIEMPSLMVRDRWFPSNSPGPLETPREGTQGVGRA